MAAYSFPLGPAARPRAIAYDRPQTKRSRTAAARRRSPRC